MVFDFGCLLLLVGVLQCFDVLFVIYCFVFLYMLFCWYTGFGGCLVLDLL